MRLVRWLEDLGLEDVDQVGGKNASLGELIRALSAEGIRVPPGFATTAEGYWAFLDHNDLREPIRADLDRLAAGEASLAETGARIRERIVGGAWPAEVEQAIREAHAELARRLEEPEPAVAVRSSATAEDLPHASFAGQQASFLNVRGADELLDAARRCLASLFTDRAIRYREEQGFAHDQVALSVGVQHMVRADRGSAGVMFTIDTENGFPDVVVIDAAWGLGESVVGGHVTPDEYRVYAPLLGREGARPIIERTLGAKETMVVYGEDGRSTRTVDTPPERRDAFVLSDDDVLALARWGQRIEDHYGRPMDIEWAQDGDGTLYVVQARPETVQAQAKAAALHHWTLQERGEVLVEGAAVGSAIATGRARVLHHIAEADAFAAGEILVTDMTDPDWVPLMRKAAGIVTDHGGRTSHAAIVSRELGIPAVIGTHSATTELADGREITLSCAQGERGVVYAGRLAFTREDLDLSDLPEVDTAIMMIVAHPDAGFRWWSVPADGIGLARVEFLIGHVIEAHPMALVHPERVDDPAARERIAVLARGYPDPVAYFVDQLSLGMARIAASRYPEPAIVRLSDFKSNEYANLVGGAAFEPHEANPMLGLRGASRYDSDAYRDGFALECRALRRAREELGFRNIVAMIPFCRTPAEADRVLEVMAGHGLERGREGLQVYVMVEIPSNVVLAEEFAARFDGFSIGSNDLTQLVLGVDRDSEELAHLFDARDPAVKRMIADVIERAHACGIPVGLCGQAPSDHPDFAEFLVECGIDSISVNPDSLLAVREHVARAEQR